MSGCGKLGRYLLWCRGQLDVKKLVGIINVTQKEQWSQDTLDSTDCGWLISPLIVFYQLKTFTHFDIMVHVYFMRTYVCVSN